MYRFLDIIISIPLLVLFTPIILLISVVTVIMDGLPIFFLQTRTGHMGREFRIIKFRTMAVTKFAKDPDQANRETDRITKLGHLLRATRIDELPQLINVTLGQMSLVGPRPHAKSHDELFSKQSPRYAERQNVRPGITGLAQVSGANGPIENGAMLEKRIFYDLIWVRQRTIRLYFKILFQTAILFVGFEKKHDDTASD